MGQEYFDQRPTLCGFLAGFGLILIGTSLLNIGFLSINRYSFTLIRINFIFYKLLKISKNLRFIFICHNKTYLKYFNMKETFAYCLITWLGGFLIDMPNLNNWWGGHYYDLDMLSCVWNRLVMNFLIQI